MIVSTLRSKLRALRRKGLPPGSPKAYAFAVVCAALAAVIGRSFSYFVEDVTLSVPFYPAIFFAAVFAGARAGAVTAVLGALTVWWTDHQYFGDDVSVLIRSINRALYVAAATIDIWVATHLRALGNLDRRSILQSPAMPDGVIPFPAPPPVARSFGERISLLWQKGLPPSSPSAFVFALACIGIATLVRSSVGWFGEYVLPLVCFFPAILIVTLVGGLEAGLISIVVSLMVVGWAFVPPYFAIGMPTPDQVIDCELFVFAALISVWLTERYRHRVGGSRGEMPAALGLIGPVVFAFGLVVATTLSLLIFAPIIGAQYLVLGYLIPTTITAILYGNIFALLTSFACGLAAAHFLFSRNVDSYMSEPSNIAGLGLFLLAALATNKIISLLTYGTGRARTNRTRESGSLFFAGSAKRARTGVLLVHSVGGSPLELKLVAVGLAQRGYTVSCCHLAGHGGSEQELLASGWPDWFASVEQALDELEKLCDVIVVGGLSVGSVLALRLAALNPARVHGLCLFAPTLRYDGWAIPWYRFLLTIGVRAPFLRRMRIADPFPYGIKDEATRAVMTDAAHASGAVKSGVQYTSLGTLQETHVLVRDVVRLLPSIKAPAIVIHPREDDISDLSNTIYLQRRLGGLVECWVLDDSYHLITVDRQRDVVMNRTAEFIGFVEQRAARQRQDAMRSRPAIVAGREFATPAESIRPSPESST